MRSSPTKSAATTELVGTALLRPNPWNPNRMDAAMYRKELASIRKFGFVVPVIVRNSSPPYEIVDGEHRWAAAGELGISVIPIHNLGDISDPVAKQLTIALNEIHGAPDKEKLGDLLKDLLTTESKADLLDLFPISPPVFDQLAGLADFDWGTLAPPEKPKGAWVERTYRMPVEAAEVLDQAIEKVRASEDELADWQCIEAIAADFLAT